MREYVAQAFVIIKLIVMIWFDYLVPSLNMKFPYAGPHHIDPGLSRVALSFFRGVIWCKYRICGQVSAGVVNSSTRSLLLLERSIDRITEPARG